MAISVQPFLSDGIRFIMDSSKNCVIRLINYSFDPSDYDDVTTQTFAGSTWVSGLIFPVRPKQGSQEALLMEQGKLLTQDKILFLGGSVNLSSSGLLIGIGSPSTEYYTLIPDGITTYEVAGSPVYRKLYLRYSIPGSIF